MFSTASIRHTQRHRFFGWALVFALGFAALHIALHDPDLGGGGLEAHDQCQVCRLNHMPAAALPLPCLLIAPQVLARVVQAPAARPRTTNLFYTAGARAPPLFNQYTH